VPALNRREMLGHSAAVGLAPLLGSLLNSNALAAGPYDDAVFEDGEPAAFASDSFCVAILPDTQNYSEHFPDTYAAQTRWLVENREKRNIACVLHLGDVTNRNSEPEWKNAAAAMKTLDDAHLPYFIVPGNHDYSQSGSCQNRETRFNDYFPRSLFAERSSFGGTYDREPDRMENSFHLYEAGGLKFIVLALEFGPRKDVIRWANEVVSKHHDRSAILITHVYLYYDDSRYDWKALGAKQDWNPHAYPVAKATADDVSDGAELWDLLVSKHPNFLFTFNGHVLNDGLGRLVTKSPLGRDVHQILVNYQMRPKGGDGWLRLLEFKADRTTVEVFDYSPTRHQCNVSGQNRFTLQIEPVV
jgi:3',5'-cyclic AMP phosphodiesterase CpdA